MRPQCIVGPGREAKTWACIFVPHKGRHTCSSVTKYKQTGIKIAAAEKMRERERERGENKDL